MERGLVIGIVGPDGCGKTMLIEEMQRRLPEIRFRTFHQRPGLLPRRTKHETTFTRPHSHPEYPRALGWLKIMYLFADNLLGWALRIRPAVSRGEVVLIERGWWDMQVDPKRYRLKPGLQLIGILGRLLPRPDYTLVLTASPEMIGDRKGELPQDEIRRQLEQWRDLLSSDWHAKNIDTDRASDIVTAEVIEIIRVRLRGPLDRRVN